MVRLLTLLAAAVLAAFVWLWLRDDAVEPAPVTPQAGADRTAAAASSERPTVDAAQLERSAAANATEPAAEEGATTFAVRGRCVEAASGEPLADCLVQLRRDEASPPIEATTAADGVFALATQHDDWNDTLKLSLSKQGYAPRNADWPRPEPGTEVDVGDVPMLAAIDVTGIVVDQQGVPVENVSMLFAYIRLSGDESTDTDSMLRARSDAAGRFHFPQPAHAGEWYIGAENTGALVEPRSVKITASDSPYQLRVVVERPDPQFSITGTVTDTAGAPIANCQLSVQGEGFIGRGVSDAQGRFTIRRAGPIPDRGKRGTSLSCSDPDNHYERIEPALDARIDWGASDVRVVMRARTAQPLRVTDERGRAVLDYTAFVFRGAREPALLRSATQRGHHEEGRCLIPNLRGGKHTLVVVPRAKELASTVRTVFDITPGSSPAEVTVKTPPRAELTVRVRNAQGAAMANSQVELLQALAPVDAQPGAAYRTVRHIDRGRAPDHVVVCSAESDDDGNARLAAPPGAWTLRVRGTEHTPLLQPVEVFAGSRSIDVTVEAAAVVHGELRSLDAFAELAAISSEGNEPVVVTVTSQDKQTEVRAEVDEHGRFRAGGLPAGDYTASLVYWLRTGEVRADTVTIELAKLSLNVGERRELPVDVEALLPATVTGRVVAGGQPLADVHCFLRRNGPGRFLMLRIATDANGNYQGVVPPGNYGFSMTYPAQPGPGWVVLVMPDEWQLAPRQQREQNFDVPLRRAHVRVLDAAGDPVVNARARIVRTGYHLPGGLQTDEAGRFSVFPAPFDAFEIEFTTDAGKTRLGPFDLPSGQIEGEITVRMPE